MKEHNFPSLKEAQGLLSHPVTTEPGEIEFEEHRQALQGYSLINVLTWREQEPLTIARDNVQGPH